jgi:hypothetical protein
MNRFMTLGKLIQFPQVHSSSKIYKETDSAISEITGTFGFHSEHRPTQLDLMDERIS